MKVTVSAKEGKGGAAKEYVLTVPIIEGGQGDYSGIEPLSKKIAAEWMKENACLCSEAVYQAVYEPVQAVVPAYVEWAIAETRKDVQRFWDAVNAELDEKLAMATELEKKIQEIRDKLQKAADKAEFKPKDRFDKGLAWTISVFWNELPPSMVKLAKGLLKLPGKVAAGLEKTDGANKIFVAFFNFGLRAVLPIMQETAIIVLRDVGAAVAGSFASRGGQLIVRRTKIGSKAYKFVRTYAKPVANGMNRTKKVGDGIGIVITEELARGTFKKAANTANRVGGKIEAIEREVYGDK